MSAARTALAAVTSTRDRDVLVLKVSGPLTGLALDKVHRTLLDDLQAAPRTKRIVVDARCAVLAIRGYEFGSWLAGWLKEGPRQPRCWVLPEAHEPESMSVWAAYQAICRENDLEILFFDRTVPALAWAQSACHEGAPERKRPLRKRH
jgi:hypothetical protein